MYKFRRRSRVQGPEVQGSILGPWRHLWCGFTRNASASLSLIQNWKPNWSLLGKMSNFNEDFGSSTPYLSLTLNVEPWTCERLPYFNGISRWSFFGLALNLDGLVKSPNSVTPAKAWVQKALKWRGSAKCFTTCPVFTGMTKVAWSGHIY